MSEISLTLTDAIGTLGVVCILAAYFCVQSGRWNHMQLRLPVTNLVGALLILVSLIETPNIPSIIIECVWILISLYGIWHVLRARRKPPE